MSKKFPSNWLTLDLFELILVSVVVFVGVIAYVVYRVIISVDERFQLPLAVAIIVLLLFTTPLSMFIGWKVGNSFSQGFMSAQKLQALETMAQKPMQTFLPPPEPPRIALADMTTDDGNQDILLA